MNLFLVRVDSSFELMNFLIDKGTDRGVDRYIYPRGLIATIMNSNFAAYQAIISGCQAYQSSSIIYIENKLRK
jgi:hypothetical protein